MLDGDDVTSCQIFHERVLRVFKVYVLAERVFRMKRNVKSYGMCPVLQGRSHSSCLALIGCQAKKDHQLQPGVNKQAQQLKCHHLLCNTGCVCVCTCKPVCMYACPNECLHMYTVVCLNLCMCVRRRSQVSSMSSALKLMIWGPENQQIWPPAGHNREHDLPVDVLEDRSSFFSVNTSLPLHNRRIHHTNSRMTSVFVLLMRKYVQLRGRECVYAYRPMIILQVSELWQSVKIIWNFMFLSLKCCTCGHDCVYFRNMWQSKAYYISQER